MYTPPEAGHGLLVEEEVHDGDVSVEGVVHVVLRVWAEGAPEDAVRRVAPGGARQVVDAVRAVRAELARRLGRSCTKNLCRVSHSHIFQRIATRGFP